MPKRVFFIYLAPLFLAVHEKFTLQQVEDHRENLAVENEDLKFPEFKSSVEV